MGNLSEVLSWEVVTARGVVAASPFFVEAAEFFAAEIRSALLNGAGAVHLVERSDYGRDTISTWNPIVKSYQST